MRPITLICKGIEEIRTLIEEQPRGAIVKPLTGSGGKNAFKIDSPKDANLNQIFEAVSGEGYLIAQGYLPEAKAGDIRLFVMNGRARLTCTELHPAAIRASAVLDTPIGGDSNRRKRVAFILRSVGAGCGDCCGIGRRGLVSNR